MTTTLDQHVTVSFAFPVLFTRNVFDPANRVLAGVFDRAGPGPHRLGVVVDRGLVRPIPDCPDGWTRIWPPTPTGCAWRNRR